MRRRTHTTQSSTYTHHTLTLCCSYCFIVVALVYVYTYTPGIMRIALRDQVRLRRCAHDGDPRAFGRCRLFLPVWMGPQTRQRSDPMDDHRDGLDPGNFPEQWSHGCDEMPMLGSYSLHDAVREAEAQRVAVAAPSIAVNPLG